eukprot:GILK01020118.1.p1 GENE.GILK01020118.1~~GILK01020118.1.p1  ORF type:complete len:132 (+),score=10.05 GILK01020118.1:38-433(+)
MGDKNCQLCNNAPHKYKCPTCGIRYCSVACFKVHKETPCAKTSEETSRKPEVVPVVQDEEDDCRVSDHQFQALVGSASIKQAVKSSDLQAILQGIDGAVDREKALENALSDPRFADFVDDVLTTIGERPTI